MVIQCSGYFVYATGKIQELVIIISQNFIWEIKRTNSGNKNCHLRNQTDKFWKSKVSFEKARGDLEIQRFLGIILKKLKWAVFPTKIYWISMSRDHILSSSRQQAKTKKHSATSIQLHNTIPYNYTRQVELHRSKEHSANSICKACSIPDTFRLVTNVDFFSEFYNNTLCACI